MYVLCKMYYIICIKYVLTVINYSIIKQKSYLLYIYKYIFIYFIKNINITDIYVQYFNTTK